MVGLVICLPYRQLPLTCRQQLGSKPAGLFGPVKACADNAHLGQAALDILRRDSEVLKCYNDRWDAIWYAELGSSAAILNAGYNIASILHRYG